MLQKNSERGRGRYYWCGVLFILLSKKKKVLFTVISIEEFAYLCDVGYLRIRLLQRKYDERRHKTN